MSSQIIPRAVNTQGPFARLREFLAPPPTHLCHLPFLAPQPSPRRALPGLPVPPPQMEGAQAGSWQGAERRAGAVA